MKAKTGFFYLGVYLLCLTTLVLQILQTRILSVISWYHLSFFAISMAMLGLTAGALRVYLRRRDYSPDNLERCLARYSLWYAVSIVVCLCFELVSVGDAASGAALLAVWTEMIILLSVPFVFAGMAVSLALTRGGRPIGIVYGVDLAGAASGCLVAIVLLNFLDGPSAVIAAGAFAALAAACFACAARSKPPAALPLPNAVSVASAIRVAAALGVFSFLNATMPTGLEPAIVKGQQENREYFDFERWNSFSRVVASRPVTGQPFMWGASPLAPVMPAVQQRGMNIDGSAGTWMPHFAGPQSLDFLDYDLTTLAYNIRHQGRAAIIGVGGGRDMLSAYHFGFRDITGVELNPIFVDLLTKDRFYRGFSGLADLPGVRFYVDDARSWFARSSESFDLIQMSLVDTWASTGAGGFTLSENGLYTVEGWLLFLRHLSPNGIFTVSRWYAPDSEEQTGRAVSLAVAALYRLGVQHPQSHIFLAGQGKLSTLIVARDPLSAADIAALRSASERYHHRILLSPDSKATSAVLGELDGARSPGELERLGAAYTLDLSPATDSRPFFFNMLRMDPVHMWEAFRLNASGAVHGNLVAAITVLLIILLSAIFVTYIIVLPVRGAIDGVERKLVTAGTAYFLLIGIGFMLVEIGFIERISVFLGYPTYALSIGLFSMILSTGIGSFASEAFGLDTARRFVAWALLLALYLAIWPAWFPQIATHFESAGILIRGIVCAGAIMPAGLLMGFGFPTGMRLANGIDPRPAPWFWGINGAAGVLGAGAAVACSVSTSIDVTVRLGAAAYLVLAVAGLTLRAIAADAPVPFEVMAEDLAAGE